MKFTLKDSCTWTPLTFWLLGDPLYLRSHSCLQWTYWQVCKLWPQQHTYVMNNLLRLKVHLRYTSVLQVFTLPSIHFYWPQNGWIQACMCCPAFFTFSCLGWICSSPLFCSDHEDVQRWPVETLMQRVQESIRYFCSVFHHHVCYHATRLQTAASLFYTVRSLLKLWSIFLYYPHICG